MQIVDLFVGFFESLAKDSPAAHRNFDGNSITAQCKTPTYWSFQECSATTSASFPRTIYSIPLQTPLANRFPENPPQNPEFNTSIFDQYYWSNRCPTTYVANADFLIFSGGGGGALKKLPRFHLYELQKTILAAIWPLTLRPTCRIGNVATFTLRGLLSHCLPSRPRLLALSFGLLAFSLP